MIGFNTVPQFGENHTKEKITTIMRLRLAIHFYDASFSEWMWMSEMQNIYFRTREDVSHAKYIHHKNPS